MTYTELLAREFSAVLRSWLDAETMRDVNAANRAAGYDESICASQDHCDANMAMDEAMRNLDLFERDEDDCPTQATMDLWNAAWQLAKTSDFYPPAAEPTDAPVTDDAYTVSFTHSDGRIVEETGPDLSYLGMHVELYVAKHTDVVDAYYWLRNADGSQIGAARQLDLA